MRRAPQLATDEDAPGLEGGRVIASYVGVPLAVGFALYALRPVLAAFAARSGGVGAVAAEIVAFNLPDGLWLFSLTALLGVLWPARGRARTAWLAGALGLGVAHEVCQGAGLASGTFDPLDLVFFGAAWLAAITLAPGDTHRTYSDRTPGERGSFT